MAALRGRRLGRERFVGGHSGRSALGLCREATAPTLGRCGVSITVGHRAVSCLELKALGGPARGYCERERGGGS